jgi:hypothetical protein
MVGIVRVMNTNDHVVVREAVRAETNQPECWTHSTFRSNVDKWLLYARSTRHRDSCFSDFKEWLHDVCLARHVDLGDDLGLGCMLRHEPQSTSMCCSRDIYVCICMYVCMNVHLYIRMYVCIYIYVCMYVNIYIYIYI